MKQLVLLDLDKTLITERYRLNCEAERVQEAVAACAARGIDTGLCSDSALPTLCYWAERLAVVGPIVFEKGAGVFYTTAGKRFILIPEATGWFGELRRRFVLQMLSRIPEWTVFIGDNTSFVEWQGRFPGSTRYAALISGIREQSFGVHVRRVEDASGRLAADVNALTRLRDEAVALARGITGKELDIDANSEYCTIIIHAKLTAKKNATHFLLERERYDSIAMIGDSLPDFMDDSRVIQYAVGNASTEYKHKCRGIASADYTAGVVEILEHLAAGRF